MTAVPTPPAGVDARPSLLASCVGEWVVRGSERYRGLRILLFQTGDGRWLEVAGELTPVRPVAAEARHARDWGFALMRAADWVAVDPRPELGPPVPDPQLSLLDPLLQGAPS